jgi:hypothetical protein
MRWKSLIPVKNWSLWSSSKPYRLSHSSSLSIKNIMLLSITSFVKFVHQLLEAQSYWEQFQLRFHVPLTLLLIIIVLARKLSFFPQVAAWSIQHIYTVKHDYIQTFWVPNMIIQRYSWPRTEAVAIMYNLLRPTNISWAVTDEHMIQVQWLWPETQSILAKVFSIVTSSISSFTKSPATESTSSSNMAV